MRRGLFFNFWIVSLWILGVSSAWAGTEDASYIIKNVEVDIQDENSEKAQRKAFQEGQKQAFDLLMNRLLIPPQPLPQGTPSTYEPLIDSHVVESEKRSKTRYKALLTFNFHKTKVQSYLKNQGIEFSSNAFKPILMLPLFHCEKKDLLWEEENPWFQALEKGFPPKDVLTIELPERNLHDIHDLSAAKALELDVQSILKLVKRYKSQGAVVLYKKGPVLQGWYISLTGDTLEIPFQENTVLNLGEPTSVSLQGLWKSLEYFLKTQVSEEPQPQSSLNATIPVNTHKQWVSTQKSLKKISSVKNLKIGSLASKKVQVLINYVGDIKILQNSLKEYDLDLKQSSDGDWIISPYGDTIQGTSPPSSPPDKS